MVNIQADLYEEFYKLVQAGDEAVARKFLHDRFAEFPSDMQEEILFAVFQEAVLARADALKGITSIKKQGLDALAKLAKMKSDLQNEVKIIDLKNTLGAK